MKVRVLCVGNSLAQDDGVGIYVARILEACPLPDGVVVERRPSLGFELLELLDQPDQHIIIVDAMRTGAPVGSCQALDIDVAASLAGRPYCGHAIGLAEVLAVAARLREAHLPAKLTVIGIEAQRLEGWGTELSAPVRAALPELVARVVAELGGDQQLAAQAREVAASVQPLALAEALGVGHDVSALVR